MKSSDTICNIKQKNIYCIRYNLYHELLSLCIYQFICSELRDLEDLSSSLDLKEMIEVPK